jgi:hypothetical protein
LVLVAGSIEPPGEELLGAPPERIRALRRRRPAMIFQEPMTALNPVMTIRAQLASRQVLAALKDMLLSNPEQMMQAYPHQLSGDQRQRVPISYSCASNHQRDRKRLYPDGCVYFARHQRPHCCALNGLTPGFAGWRFSTRLTWPNAGPR